MSEKAVPGFVDHVQAWQEWWRHPFRAKPDQINWRGPNCWTAFFVIVSIGMSLIPLKLQYFSFLNHLHALGALLFINSGILVRMLKSYGYAIIAFEPKNPLAAKRANEQIKLTSTLINASAAAAVSIFALSEMLRSETPNYMLISLAIGAAAIIHSTARHLLGLLKDEAKDAYGP